MRKIVFLILIFIFARPFQLSTALTPQIILSHYQITINIVEGQKGPAMAEIPVRVLVKSDIANWTVHYHATPLVNETGTVLPPSQLLMQTPYTKNFDSLDVPRLVGKGTSPTGVKPLEIGNIVIGFNATGFEKPGIYEGQIVSPDGGPTIFVRVIIAKSIIKTGEEFDPESKKGPKIRITVSPNNIHFPVTGAPGEYDATSSVILSVESKYGFIVKAQATPLSGKLKNIPPSRIYVKSDGTFESLDKGVIVLERIEEIHPEKERTVTKKLDFRLKTTREDPAGEYTGNIVFTVEPQL